MQINSPSNNHKKIMVSYSLNLFIYYWNTKYTVPKNLWERLFPQICRNNQQGTNFLFQQSMWEPSYMQQTSPLNVFFFLLEHLVLAKTCQNGSSKTLLELFQQKLARTVLAKTSPNCPFSIIPLPGVAKLSQVPAATKLSQAEVSFIISN